MPSTWVDFCTNTPVPVDLDVRWIDGTDPLEPPLQVHMLDRHTVTIRQSLLTDPDAPFLYLFFGNERAVLVDTGASPDPDVWPLRTTVDGLLESWLADHPRASYDLIVVHTHDHRDHTDGDVQFRDRPRTTVVPVDLESVRSAFGFTTWPDEIVALDLGGRVLNVIGGPGHVPAAVVFHDPWTGILLTGDTVYPGRLFIRDTRAYVDTLNRLVAFCETVPVTHVLGCHIEMSGRPGHDYPLGATRHPDEPSLQMSPAQLVRVRDRAVAVAQRPAIHRFDDVILYNGNRPVDRRRLAARGALTRLTARLGFTGSSRGRP
jgi:glyoxylase-like metal-dependent hydrolase (beta-lactamase superfamily II)